MKEEGNCAIELLPRVVGVERHRLLTDGEGVSTLVVFHGCPLRCRYCLNPLTLTDGWRWKPIRCKDLYGQLKVDELYSLATGGGVTFGGGEPALYPGFITEFRGLCGKDWLLTLETSLNVPRENIVRLLPVVDRFIVDIKDVHLEIYRRYTGKDNRGVLENLRFLVEKGRSNDVTVRVPLIPGYNTMEEQEDSRLVLERMGLNCFDLFTYETDRTDE